MRGVTLAVEGSLDEVVLKRLVNSHGLMVDAVYGFRGKSKIDQQTAAYSNAGRFAPWIVLRDLDQDAECPPTFLQSRNIASTSLFRFQLAVNAIESWLLGDRKGLARFLSVPVAKLPVQPETVPDPKVLVVQLSRSSRSKDIAAGLVPAPGSSASVGPTYSSKMSEFAMNHWDLNAASQRCPSLASMTGHLTKLVATLAAEDENA
jgi:hypothetical protein